MVFESVLSKELVSYPVAGNAIDSYLVATSAFFLSLAVLRVFKFVVIRHLKALAAKTATDLDDLIIRSIDTIGWFFYGILSLYIALQLLTVPPILSTLVLYILVTLGALYAVRILHCVIDYVKQKMIAEQLLESKDADTSVIDLLANVVKSVLWFIAGLLIISNLGYDITPMIAGLGIGGIAIAFALQNVLTDVFASFSIYFDKPFKVGDTIQIGSDIGTVKKIGIKSTRLESLQGHELVISNKELTESRINNFKKMEKRRIIFSFGVTYETPVAKLRRVPDIVTALISRIPDTEVDRIHFFKFGDCSLIFEVSYFILGNEYTKYADTQQALNLALLEAFEKEGIRMAYPTQTLYVRKEK